MILLVTELPGVRKIVLGDAVAEARDYGDGFTSWAQHFVVKTSFRRLEFCL